MNTKIEIQTFVIVCVFIYYSSVDGLPLNETQTTPAIIKNPLEPEWSYKGDLISFNNM
jgi:hypothetical protein